MTFRSSLTEFIPKDCEMACFHRNTPLKNLLQVNSRGLTIGWPDICLVGHFLRDNDHI